MPYDTTLQFISRVEDCFSSSLIWSLCFALLNIGLARVQSDFSMKCFGKTQTQFLATPIECGGRVSVLSLTSSSSGVSLLPGE